MTREGLLDELDWLIEAMERLRAVRTAIISLDPDVNADTCVLAGPAVPPTVWRYGPKPADHPSIGKQCPVCHVSFGEGDMTTVVTTHAASVHDAHEAQAGREFEAVAVEVHWDCRSTSATWYTPASPHGEAQDTAAVAGEAAGHGEAQGAGASIAAGAGRAYGHGSG